MNWFVFRMGWGVPGGLFMHWAGKPAWCAPCEFFDWEELMRTLRRRFKRSGLVIIGIVCDRQWHAGCVRVRVEVVRRCRIIKL